MLQDRTQTSPSQSHPSTADTAAQQPKEPTVDDPTAALLEAPSRPVSSAVAVRHQTTGCAGDAGQ